MPYSVVFEFEVDRVAGAGRMDGHARGDLAGRGCWRLYEDAGVTAVVYEWNVRTTKRLDEPRLAASRDRSSSGTTTSSCAGAARAWHGGWACV